MQSGTIAARKCKTATKETRKLYGCDEALPDHLAWFEFGIKFNRCPCFYVQDDSYVREALKIWKWKQCGFLPFSGTWMDQPGLIIEIIEYVDFLMLEKQNAESKIRNRNASEGQGRSKTAP